MLTQWKTPGFCRNKERERSLRNVFYSFCFKGQGIRKKSFSERCGGFTSTLAKNEILDCIVGMTVVSYELISSEEWLINWRDPFHTLCWTSLFAVTHGQSQLRNFPPPRPKPHFPHCHFQLDASTDKPQLAENWHWILQSTSINYLKQYLLCCFILSNMKHPRLQLGISIIVSFWRLFLHNGTQHELHI